MAKKIPKFKHEISKYGYDRWQCPFCKEWLYDRILHSHFASKAKRETLQKALGEIKSTPHFDFYLKHTREEVVVRRIWLVDLRKEVK